MKNIKLNNRRLKTLLSDTIDIVFNDQSLQKLITRTKPRGKGDKLIDGPHPTSEEYLRKALSLKVRDFGFPRAVLGLGSSLGKSPENYEVFTNLDHQVTKIGKHLGTPMNALTMIYPDRGYIGWHHNGNAPGYNVLCTYSQDGDGKFMYYDRATDKIIVMPDQQGWSVKVGYYASEKAGDDKVYWHAADTSKQRITLAWILNHKDMWSNLISEISDGDFDRDFVLSQGT